MVWGHYVALGGLATFKFMFAPIYGRTVGLTFLETYLVTLIGAAGTAVFFYLLAGYFMKRTAHKRLIKRLNAVYHNEVYVEPKRFTFVNKLIVRVKRSIGIYGITFYAPFFLSVPIGTIIATKFYGKNPKTLPFILLGLSKNALITTTIVYFV